MRAATGAKVGSQECLLFTVEAVGAQWWGLFTLHTWRAFAIHSVPLVRALLLITAIEIDIIVATLPAIGIEATFSWRFQGFLPEPHEAFTSQAVCLKTVAVFANYPKTGWTGA